MIEEPHRPLLPEEDALDDPDEDDEADPSLPGDLWFITRAIGDLPSLQPERRIPHRILLAGPNPGL